MKAEWQKSEQSLAHRLFSASPLPLLNYIVWCVRILEICSLYFFLTRDAVKKDEIVSFVITFLEKEEGWGHIPSDRYATTMVWTTLLLVASGNRQIAIELVKRSVVWLCDHVEKGFGLARYEADEYDETICLLGYPFNFIEVEKNTNSFLATVLTDLAALLAPQFYEDVINDFSACEITYYYWQFPDSKAVTVIDTNECLAYANVPHNDALKDFADFDYAAHIKDEPKAFGIVNKWGHGSLVLLSVLLKDRYFPTMWPKMIESWWSGEYLTHNADLGI